MSSRSTEDRYGTLAVALHWMSAAGVLVLLVLGLTMTRIDGGENTLMYRIHVGLGMTIAGLTVVRAVWRLVEPSPRTPAMPRWRRFVYVGNHAAFYLVLLALAGSGVATLVASGITPIPTSVEASSVENVRAGDAHFVLALIFTALFVMHVIGVVTYQRTKGDVFARMGVDGVASPERNSATPGSRTTNDPNR